MNHSTAFCQHNAFDQRACSSYKKLVWATNYDFRIYEVPVLHIHICHLQNGYIDGMYLDVVSRTKIALGSFLFLLHKSSKG